MARKPFPSPAGVYRLYKFVVKVFADGQVQTSDGSHKSHASFTKVKKYMEKYKTYAETSRPRTTGQSTAAGVEAADKMEATTKVVETEGVVGRERVETARAAEKRPRKKVDVVVEKGSGKMAEENGGQGTKGKEPEQVKGAHETEERGGRELTKTRPRSTAKPKVNRDGGKMTVSVRNLPKKKVKKSPETVPSSEDEEEVKPVSKERPKRKKRALEEDEEKPKSKEKSKRRVPVAEKGRVTRKKERVPVSDDDEEMEEEEEEEEDIEDDEESEAADTKTPLARAQARPTKKKRLPTGDSKDLPMHLEVDDKCARCAKLKQKCFWTTEAIKKSGPKACMQCKERKIGCVNGFKNSGPVLLDLETPLGDLADVLAPAPHTEGVPRPGVLGESDGVPHTLGELLVELLNTGRTAREENAELRAEVKNLSRTLGTIIRYNQQHHGALMDELAALPSKVGPPPASLHATPTQFTMATDLRQPHPSPTPLELPRPRLTKTAPEKLDIIPLPITLPPAPLLLDVVGIKGPSFSDSEDEGTPPPEGASPQTSRLPAGSASRAGSAVEGDNDEGEQDAEGDDDDTIPSVVANRTRQKTKPAGSKEGSKGSGSPVGEIAGEAQTRAESKKRKVASDAEEEDENKKVVPKKKSKAAARKPAKGKATGKKS